MKITVSNLALKYDGHMLFENVSFEVPSGRKYCIGGPSGSGKSSVLKAMLGFVKPQSGEIKISDEVVSDETVWQLRHKIAYVTQEPDLGRHGVLDCIRRPFGYKANVHLQWQQEKVDELFDCFKLSRKLYDKNTADLSGGEKQRVAIITALLLDRPVMLLDEPCSALDKASKHILKNTLAELPKTVVFISHESELLDIADGTYNLTGGPAHE